MGRKCSIYGCFSGYDGPKSDEKVTIYKFPQNEEECRQWVLRLPYEIGNVTKYMGICALHWPPDAPMARRRRGRYAVPTVPPSIFHTLPSSSLRTPNPRKISLCDIRTPQPTDELETYRKLERFLLVNFQAVFLEKFSDNGFKFTYNDRTNALILSKERTGPIHDFSIYLCLREDGESLLISYEAFRGIKNIRHPLLKNELQYWSELEELVRYITNFEVSEDDLKFKLLSQAITRYNSPKNSEYSNEIEATIQCKAET